MDSRETNAPTTLHLDSTEATQPETCGATSGPDQRKPLHQRCVVALLPPEI